MRKRFPYGGKNDNETLLKDSSYTAALLDIATEMASSRGMATSNTFKTLKEFKSLASFSCSPTPRRKTNITTYCFSVLPLEEQLSSF
jgi:hypothetical protein